MGKKLLRLKHIIGDPGADPPVPAKIPVSKSTWWSWVASGKAPPAIRLGEKTTCWDEEAIDAFIVSRSKEG